MVNALNQLHNLAVVSPAKRTTLSLGPAEQMLEQLSTGEKHCGNGEQRQQENEVFAHGV